MRRTTFQYKQQPLVERVAITPPFRHSALFHDEGCFVYVHGKKVTFHSAHDQTNVGTNEAVLLKCNRYLVDFLEAQKDEKELFVTIFHLYPDLLKECNLEEIFEPEKLDIGIPETKLIANSNVIDHFVRSLDLYFENPHLVTDTIIKAKVRELFSILVQTKNIKSVVELYATLFTENTLDLAHTVKVHLFSTLSMSELAELCHMSVSTFRREFKKQFNDTPSNYFTEKRIEKAKTILQLTNTAISDIAYEIGYSDPLYFTRIFKKRVGQSPTAFRKQLK